MIDWAQKTELVIPRHSTFGPSGYEIQPEATYFGYGRTATALSY